MNGKKLSVSAEEVAGVSISPDTSPPTPRLAPAVPPLVKIALAPFVLVLPLLCFVAIAVRLFLRRYEPRVQHAWTRYICSLQILSGLVATMLFVFALMWPRSPITPPLFESHPLDAITAFPHFNHPGPRTVEEIANGFKNAVFIVARKPRWNRLSREDLPATGFGSGVLLFANQGGYLVLTARHVIDGDKWQRSNPFSGNVALAGEEGDFSFAQIAGRHLDLDLMLLCVTRHSGNSRFVQPIVGSPEITLGEQVVVFGHPEGLYFSVSDGIVSRKTSVGNIQLTAPVSPGASGGPVYDNQGRLLGIVSSMLDKQHYPESENLNFAVCADAVFRPKEWALTAQGTKLLNEFISSSRDATNSSPSSLAGPTPNTTTANKPH